MNTILQLITALWFIVVLAASQPAYASAGTSAETSVETPCELKHIATELNQQPELNQFEQLKTVAVLTQPLKSSGYLLLAEKNTIVWQTQSPIKSTTVISSDSFKQYNKNDDAVTVPANGNNQTSQLISSTFLSILSGDFEALKSNFDVTAICQSSNWELNLTPTSPQVKRAIKHIRITGNETIERLTFTEANDDTTQITFTQSDDSSIRQALGQFLVD